MMKSSGKAVRTNAEEHTQARLHSGTHGGRRIRKAYHQKVKTGCYTCRRRVKCDEAKPLCKTCTKNGYDCHVYAQLEPLRLVLGSAPGNIYGRNEHQACQFFMETAMTWFDIKTAPWKMDCRVDEFWDPVVLQVTQSEPAIKHIMLAWAELHRRILYERVSPNEPFENDFFWQNHCQALRLLGSKKQVDMGVMLIACVLFCILENFRGRRDIFLRHLRSGLRILSHYDSIQTDYRSCICDNIIARYVKPIIIAFHSNLGNTTEFQLLPPREQIADRLIKLKEAGRVVKSWN